MAINAMKSALTSLSVKRTWGSTEFCLTEYPPSLPGKYVVGKGEGTTLDELNNSLAALKFGQALAEVKDYAYVGGPNATV